MSTKPVIAVVTGTGTQGRSVCAAFHQSGRWAVRALTRDPAGPAARKLAEQGIEVVKADFEKKDEVLNAFEGAYAVYCVTIPPWQTGYGNTISEYDQGVLQVDAAKAANVKLILWSTLPYVGPDFLNAGGCELHDHKAQVEGYIKSQGIASVFISPAVFAENMYVWPMLRWIDDGEKLEFWHYAVDADKPVPFVWAERDLGPSVLALAEDFQKFESSGRSLLEHPLNHTIQPVGSWRTTWGNIARTIERLTGVPVQHTIHPNVDERWHPDLTKALVYQNVHGFYPSHAFPPPVFVNLGVSFNTLDDFVVQKIIPLFGKDTQR